MLKMLLDRIVLISICVSLVVVTLLSSRLYYENKIEKILKQSEEQKIEESTEQKEEKRLKDTLNKTYNKYRDDELTIENKQKIDKIKTFIAEYPEYKSVEESYIKLTDVFLEYNIPVQQYAAAWNYYNQKNKEK